MQNSTPLMMAHPPLAASGITLLQVLYAHPASSYLVQAAGAHTRANGCTTGRTDAPLGDAVSRAPTPHAQHTMEAVSSPARAEPRTQRIHPDVVVDGTDGDVQARQLRVVGGAVLHQLRVITGKAENAVVLHDRVRLGAVGDDDVVGPAAEQEQVVLEHVEGVGRALAGSNPLGPLVPSAHGHGKGEETGNGNGAHGSRTNRVERFGHWCRVVWPATDSYRGFLCSPVPICTRGAATSGTGMGT